MKIASSPTLEGLQKMLNEFFYSTTYKVNDDLSVENSKGINNDIVVKKKAGRYIAAFKG